MLSFAGLVRRLDVTIWADADVLSWVRHRLKDEVLTFKMRE